MPWLWRGMLLSLPGRHVGSMSRLQEIKNNFWSRSLDQPGWLASYPIVLAFQLQAQSIQKSPLLISSSMQMLLKSALVKLEGLPPRRPLCCPASADRLATAAATRTNIWPTASNRDADGEDDKKTITKNKDKRYH